MAVAVFCGVAGVQPQSETVWRQATKYNVPRIAFVNKMDRTGANFQNALDDMRNKLKAYAYPIFLPIGAEDQLAGVIDLVNQKAIVWGPGDVANEGLKYEITEIPDALKEKAKTALEELIDAVSNKDDAIAELVLWVGFLQWHLRPHGGLQGLPEPIIRDLHNVENRDAVLAWDERTQLLDAQGQAWP